MNNKPLKAYVQEQAEKLGISFRCAQQRMYRTMHNRHISKEKRVEYPSVKRLGGNMVFVEEQ